jgi:hypothetical protein
MLEQVDFSGWQVYPEANIGMREPNALEGGK